MLLTIPWFLSILGGRVNIDPATKVPNYKGNPKLDTTNAGLFNAGVSLSKMVHVEAYIMLLTAMTYLVLQIPGMMYHDRTRAEQAAGEKIFAQIGACLCLLFFCGYLYLQYLHSGAANSLQDKSRDEYLRDAIAQKKVTLLGVMMTEYQAEMRERRGRRATSPYHLAGTAEESAALAAGSRPSGGDFSERYMRRLRKILRPFFKSYDTDDSGNLQIEELRVLFEDMGESLTRQQVLDLFSKFDTDKNGHIDYEEFVKGVCDFIVLKQNNGASNWDRRFTAAYGSTAAAGAARGRRTRSGSSQGSPRVRRSPRYSLCTGLVNAFFHLQDLEAYGVGRPGAGASSDDEDEDSEDSEEEDEMPDDLKHLSPAEQQRRIKWRAAAMMGLGSIILIIISDPVVNVLDEIGKRTGIPSFYIAFVFAPMASNASELVAAYNYAQKKTRATISISLATLLGAAIMNNTFVLGVFMMLVATQDLSWEFFAETLSILLVQVTMAAFALKNTHTLMDAFMILSLYPLSLACVYLLQAHGWD